jgi:adenine-specific DNA-methyltransferase
LAEQFDSELIKLLLNNKTTKAHFFDAIDEATIFNYRKFIDYIDDKNFLIDSYTKFANKVGLTISNKHMQQINEVALSFPFKDCVLEGGQSKDDEKRKEIFFNEVLANDEINRLLDKKVITSAKKYTKDGASDEINFKRDENGLIKDNLIIKGNNLLALHTLKSNFAGKVKLIYIDPPYNTGNDSFNYNDNFNHSTWLTFMKNRLEVARDLLSDDGVIFIQCDDNEQAYLKVLMDEIFGREGFLSTIISQSTPNGRDYGGIAKTHDYIHIYQKQKNVFEMNMLLVKDKKFSHKDDIGKYNIHPLYNSNVNFNKKNRPNLYYPIYLLENEKNESDFYKLSMKKLENSIEVFPPKSIKDNVQFVWRWGKEKSDQNINTEIMGHKTTNGNFRIVQKMRTTKKYARSIWDGAEFSNRRATEDLQKLFSEKLFATPKPEALLQRIIEIATQEGDLVLDYHLGSGTTCAVAHKMGRQYIGIEQMDYIEDIAVKRMQKVIGKTVKKDGELLERVDFDNGGISKSVDWQGGGEFIYFELDKYNQAFIEKIAKVNEKNILKLYDDIIEKAFLNYDVESEKLKDKKQDFKALNLSDKKEFLFSILNKNQLYKNLSEIDDKDLQVDENVKALNKGFYNE